MKKVCKNIFEITTTLILISGIIGLILVFAPQAKNYKSNGFSFWIFDSFQSRGEKCIKAHPEYNYNHKKEHHVVWKKLKNEL